MKRRVSWFILPLLCWSAVLPSAGIAQETTVSETSVELRPVGAVAVDWAAMSTLDLETAVEIALAGNPGLEAAAARVRQAKAQVDQARSTYWPRLDANASGARVAIVRKRLPAESCRRPAAEPGRRHRGSRRNTTMPT